MSKTLILNSSNGVTFVARMVETGDKYGRNNCLTYGPGEDGERFRKNDPLIEFYDARFPHTEYGQFVSRYYASTVINHIGALSLDMGISDWTVDAWCMMQVNQWLTREWLKVE